MKTIKEVTDLLLKRAGELDSKTEVVEKMRIELDASKAELDAAKAKSLIGGGGFAPISHSNNSDEMRALKWFRCRDAKGLLNVNTAAPEFRRVPEEMKHLVITLKQDVDIARMTQQILYGAPADQEVPGADGSGMVLSGNVKNWAGSNYGREVTMPRLKAFDTTTAGAGLEWVPTAQTSSYIEEYELMRQVVAKFPKVNMPTKTYELSKQDGVTKARLQAELGTLTDANFGTDKISMTAVKLTEYYKLSEEITEDSAPNILAAGRQEVVEAQGRAWEDSCLNGDIAATMDSDIGGATDNRRAWDGLRRLALTNGATVDVLNAALDLPALRSMEKLMSIKGINVRQLMWIPSASAYYDMRDIDEVTTVEKFGPQATILQGALAALDGIPIYTSEFQREDLNATGVYDGVTTDRKSIALVNFTRFFMGVRRPVRVAAVRNPTPPADEWLLASWWRGDFKGHAQVAAKPDVVYGINIA